MHRAFVENAFAATELLARAEMLVVPDARPAEARTHKTLKSLYNQWANIGNTEPRFARLLNRLLELRANARHLAGPLDLSSQEVSNLLVEVGDLRSRVEGLVGEDDPDPASPPQKQLMAVASQPLKAGQIVTSDSAKFFA